MAGKQFLKKHENCILSLAMALILAGILAARFDFYYDLNDDVLIKDILSGVYSGTPDGHTMQLLYPLGVLLALLYRGLSIPVFGAFCFSASLGVSGRSDTGAPCWWTRSGQHVMARLLHQGCAVQRLPRVWQSLRYAAHGILPLRVWA